MHARQGKKPMQRVRDRAALFVPHSDSFNFFIDHGLALAVQALDPV